jgi:hypothetical protein
MVLMFHLQLNLMSMQKSAILILFLILGISNHYAWNNNFSPTDKTQSTFSISTIDNRFDVGLVYQT